MPIKNTDTRTLINFSTSFQQLRNNIAELFLTQPDKAVDALWDSSLPFPKNRIRDEIISLQKNLLIPIEKLFNTAIAQQADLSQLLQQLSQKQTASSTPELYRAAIVEVTAQLKEVSQDLMKLNNAKVKLDDARQQFTHLAVDQLEPWKQLLQEITLEFFEFLSNKFNIQIADNDPRKALLAKEVHKLSAKDMVTLIQQLFTTEV